MEFQYTWKKSSEKYSIIVSVSLCHLLKNVCENNILSEQTEHRSCNEIVQHPTEPHSCLQGENNRFYYTWCCQSVFDLPTQITKYSTLKSHFKIFIFLTTKHSYILEVISVPCHTLPDALRHCPRTQLPPFPALALPAPGRFFPWIVPVLCFCLCKGLTLTMLPEGRKGL